jgi:hypothetical protein
MDLLDRLHEWNVAMAALLACQAAHQADDQEYFCADRDVAVRVARELFFRELYRLIDNPQARR